MPNLIWQGAAPPRALARALRDARMTVVRGRGEALDAPVVIFTATGRPPAGPSAGRWIWVSAVGFDRSRAVDAILRGA